MLGGVRVHARPQLLESQANAGRLVDADLLVDGEVQRQVQEGFISPPSGTQSLSTAASASASRA
jgi:hypothetical protein